MKKLTRLFALLLAFVLMLSMFSCGKTTDDNEDEEETRYTITEKEWNAFREMNNSTNEAKYYSVDGLYQTIVVKEADGFYCMCNTVYEETQNSGDDTTLSSAAISVPSTGGYTVDTGNTYDTGTIDTGDYGVDSYGMRKAKGADAYEITDSADSIVIDEFNASSGYDIGYFQGSTSASFPSVTIQSSLVLEVEGTFDNYYEVLVPSYYYSTFYDSLGNEYKVNRWELGSCTKEHNGVVYHEIEATDVDGNVVKKWVDPDDLLYVAYATETEDDIAFEDLVYDKAEKAYILEQDLGYVKTKGYFYFENGKIVKGLLFYVLDEEGEEPYDISTLTPKSNYSSSEYTTVVTTYSNVGKTKVEEHTFSESDIIAPKEQ